MQEPSYVELLAQREALERKIQEVRRQEIERAAIEIRERMALLGMTVADLTRVKVPSTSQAKHTLAPKYRDPKTGATWAGRGRLPTWMETAIAQGAKQEDFLIQN